MIDVDSIGLVLEVLRPERRALCDLLSELDADQWEAPTESQAADILTWAYTADEIRGLVDGPPEQNGVLSSFGGRPSASR